MPRTLTCWLHRHPLNRSRTWILARCSWRTSSCRSRQVHVPAPEKPNSHSAVLLQTGSVTRRLYRCFYNYKTRSGAWCFLLTMVVTVFPPWPLPLSPLRHHGTCLCVVVQTVPTTCSFPTLERGQQHYKIHSAQYKTMQTVFPAGTDW